MQAPNCRGVLRARDCFDGLFWHDVARCRSAFRWVGINAGGRLGSAPSPPFIQCKSMLILPDRGPKRAA